MLLKKCIFVQLQSGEESYSGRQGGRETLKDCREDFYTRKKTNEKNETRLRKRCTGEKELSSYNFEVRALRQKG